MHIEPGIVHGAKMALASATAAGVASVSLKLAYDEIRKSNIGSFLIRVALATAATFFCFEVLPNFPIGVSEVHFILGTSLFLVFGMGAAAFGLAMGLLFQSLFLAPTDLPMYFVNVTTLLAPLLGISIMSRRLLPKSKAYVELGYSDVLKLSALYQGGIILWVAFWVFYGQGIGAESFASVMSFAAAYLVVIIIEPVIDLTLLAIAKGMRSHSSSFEGFVTSRLYSKSA